MTSQSMWRLGRSIALWGVVQKAHLKWGILMKRLFMKRLTVALTVLVMGLAQAGPEPDPVSDAEYQARVAQFASIGAAGEYEDPGDGQSTSANLGTLIGQLMTNPNDADALDRLSRWYDTPPAGDYFNHYSTGFAVNKWWDNLSTDQRNNIRANMSSVGDWIGLGTPNHQLMRNVGGALYGQLWPNDPVYTIWTGGGSNQTGNQVVAAVKPRLLAIAKNLYSRGEYEHMSPTYMPLHVGAWAALYDQTNDPELKAAANAALLYFATTLASSHLYGQHVGPFSRENVTQRALYETDGATPNLAATQRLTWLWWGDNSRNRVGYWDPRRVGGPAFIAAASGWRPNAAINHIALTTQPFTTRGSAPFMTHAGGSVPQATPYPNSSGINYLLPHPYDNLPGANSFTWYKEQRFAIGSQWLNWDPDGVYEQSTGTGIIYNVSGPKGTQMLDITHPYWKMIRQGGQGDFEARQSPFENTSHHLNTLISLFNIPVNDPWAERGRTDFRENKSSPLIQEGRLRYPNTRDELVEEGGWVFIRDAEVYFAIRPLNSYTISSGSALGRSNPYNAGQFDVIRSNGPRTGFVVDVVTSAEFASFAAFRSAVLAQPLTINLAVPSVSYQSVRGHTLTASWVPVDYTYDYFPTTANPTYQPAGAPGPIRVRNDMTVNGVPVLADTTYPVLVSPYVNCQDYTMTVATPAGGFSVDWRGGVPVFSDQ